MVAPGPSSHQLLHDAVAEHASEEPRDACDDRPEPGLPEALHFDVSRRLTAHEAGHAGAIGRAISRSVRLIWRRQTDSGSGSKTWSASAGTTCHAPRAISRSSCPEPQPA